MTTALQDLVAIRDLSLDAWFAQGARTRWKATRHRIGSVLAAGAIGIGGAVFSSPRIPLQLNPTASTLPVVVTVEQAHAIELARVEELGRSIDRQLEALGTRDYSTVAPSRLARAKQVADRIAQRKQLS